MPIDRARNIVFIHVPKTGGTTVEQVLGLDAPQHLFSETPVRDLDPPHKTPQHFTWTELRRNVTPEFLARAFSFAFVRNPWDRFVSEYCWRRGWYFKDVPARADFHYRASDLETLDAFVRVFELPKEAREHARQGFDGHIETQFSFVIDERRELALDFVGRFETFDADFRRVATRLGIAVDRVPQYGRSRRHEDYRRYYSSYSRSAVASFYREDIEAFGYAF